MLMEFICHYYCRRPAVCPSTGNSAVIISVEFWGTRHHFKAMARTFLVDSICSAQGKCQTSMEHGALDPSHFCRPRRKANRASLVVANNA